ncbi:MAG: metallophosphoesterase family protein [Verrucomicrobiota bacterium]
MPATASQRMKSSGRAAPAPAAGGKERAFAAPSARFHHVNVDGLKPGTPYRFRVESDGAKAEGAFRTAVKPGRPFTFAAWGDNRSQPERHAEVAAALTKFKPDFILNTGDLVAYGPGEPLWTQFFEIERALLRASPVYAVPGNHEMNASAYFAYFPFPHDFTFDYGDAHFVALDSNLSAANLAKQVEWLKADLAAHQSARWRIVFLHHPVYTCTDRPARRGEAEVTRKRLEQTLQDGRVQLVLSGHDHNYQRHEAEGITYIVTGGGGAPLYDLKADTPNVKAAKAAHHHVEVSVQQDLMKVRAVEPTGAVIDSFEIRSAR